MDSQSMFKTKQESKFSSGVGSGVGGALTQAFRRAFHRSGQAHATEFRAGLTEYEQQQQTRLQLSDAEIALFERRYTESTVRVNLTGAGTELQRAIETHTVHDAREAQLPQMGKIERKRMMDKIEDDQKAGYKALKKESHKTFATLDDVTTPWMKENVMKKKVELPGTGPQPETVEQQELLKRVLSGDYSNLQQMDPVLRSLAAKTYMERLNVSGAIGSPEDLVNALFREKGVSALMNPLFRIGVSILRNGGTLDLKQFPGFAQRQWDMVEDLCNQRIMSATLYTVPEKPLPGDTEADLLRNHQSQIFIAKTLLASHLGRLKCITKKPAAETDWDRGVASAFAHCSRVGFTLPGDSKTLDTFAGNEHGLRAGFQTRTAATHTLGRKRRGSATSKLKEKKIGPKYFYRYPLVFFGQQGMNVAVGGYGNGGIAGKKGMRKIKNDGSGGHLYMHVEQGGQFTNTGLLIGFESDSPGTMNMTGHTHDAKATPEFVSSFGGQRTDEIGEKYGGRMVDLSGVSKEEFESKMSTLEDKMTMLFYAAEKGTQAQKEKAQAELMFIGDMLSGKLMTAQEMDRVLQKVRL
ncbi:MAG: hypothetical protein K6E50_11860 [Lachnospiraceae bacterium]|nr:hypothetical protein [Lachnospiraceae bacterium]